MKPNYRQFPSKFAKHIPLAAVLCLLTSCSHPDPNRVQGYVEGEYVYVASPNAGALETLTVQRGAQVKAGDALFALESVAEKAARDEADRKLTQARASLEDARKGKRPSEIEALDAQRQRAQVSLEFSEKEFARQEKLSRSPGAVAEQDLDRARAVRDQDRQSLAQLTADTKTAHL